MKYYKFFIIITSILMSCDITAQDYKKCYILLKNGTRHEGFIKKFNSISEEFVFRTDKKSKKVKYKSKDITEIGLFINKELGIYHSHRMAKYNLNCTKLKERKRLYWAAQIYKSESIEAYQYYLRTPSSIPIFTPRFYGSIPYVDKDLKFAIKFPELGYLIEIDEQDKGAKELDSRKMKRKMIKYMSLHCSAFAESIEDKKDELDDFMDFLEYYSELCDLD